MVNISKMLDNEENRGSVLLVNVNTKYLFFQETHPGKKKHTHIVHVIPFYVLNIKVKIWDKVSILQ